MLLDLTHTECSLSEQDNSFLNPGEKKKRVFLEFHDSHSSPYC